MPVSSRCGLIGAGGAFDAWALSKASRFFASATSCLNFALIARWSANRFDEAMLAQELFTRASMSSAWARRLTPAGA
jgi:hypothetical protein